MTRLFPVARALLPLAGALALAGCGGSNDDETTYQADITDESGGDFVVHDADETGVPVELPDTAMTPVAPGSEATPMATPVGTPTPE